MSDHPVYLDFPAGVIELTPSAITINSGYLPYLVVSGFVRPYKNSCYEISIQAECLGGEGVNPAVIEEIISTSKIEVSVDILKQVFADHTQPFKLLTHSFFNDGWTFHSLTSLSISMRPFMQTIGKGILPSMDFYLSAQTSYVSPKPNSQIIHPIQSIEPINRPRTSFLDVD
jgi:hypothetical protein